MAIVDDVKCPRCDRKYSGVRSRCPYCGARRIGFGKYSKDNDNARGKMLISVLILAVFTVAAAIMLFSTPTEPIATPEPEPIISPDEINSLPGLDAEPTPTPEPVETPPPPPSVESIAVMYGGNPLQYGLEFSQKAGTSDNAFNVKVEPPGLDIDVLIESENEDVFTVERVYGGRENGFEVTITGERGDWAYLIVSAGDIDLRVKVSVN